MTERQTGDSGGDFEHQVFVPRSRRQAPLNGSVTWKTVLGTIAMIGIEAWHAAARG